MRITLIILACFLIFCGDSLSQSLVRNVICSFGNQTQQDGILIRQTIGQPSNTLSISNDNLVLRQGFQQPVISGKEVMNKTLEFKLFPNPASSETNIKFSNQGSPYSIQIYNVSGELIYNQQNIEEQLFPIKLLSFKSGIYLVKVSCNNLLGVKKLIITQDHI